MKPGVPQLACGIVLASCAGLARADSKADLRAGELLYVQCTGCHAPAYHRTGPLHCGLLGRKAGTVPGFTFTPALERANLTWDRETLNRFLRAPLGAVPGTSMAFAGIASDTERLQLIAYLATLNANNPVCKMRYKYASDDWSDNETSRSSTATAYGRCARRTPA